MGLKFPLTLLATASVGTVLVVAGELSYAASGITLFLVGSAVIAAYAAGVEWLVLRRVRQLQQYILQLRDEPGTPPPQWHLKELTDLAEAARVIRHHASSGTARILERPPVTAEQHTARFDSPRSMPRGSRCWLRWRRSTGRRFHTQPSGISATCRAFWFRPKNPSLPALLTRRRRFFRAQRYKPRRPPGPNRNLRSRPFGERSHASRYGRSKPSG
jgi:hypothetical protein